jgi:hypothetical protein
MAELSLPPATIPIADGTGLTPLPWRRFLEGVFRRLGGAVDFVSIAYRAAQEAAAGGDLSGVAAVADAAYAEVSLLGSYPVGVAIAGVASTGVASVTDHHRRYSLGAPPVEVGGGLVAGLSYGADYWIYYDQASRAGGAVTYQATGVYADAFPSHDAPNRHFVGALRMPASSGAANTTGKAALPPGYTAT